MLCMQVTNSDVQFLEALNSLFMYSGKTIRTNEILHLTQLMMQKLLCMV
jgi:hypothetical protein